MLKKHERSLRALYAVYSHTSDLNARLPGQAMGYDDFGSLCKDLDLYDEYLPQREGSQIFSWSR